jgi:hypothetical protein
MFPTTLQSLTTADSVSLYGLRNSSLPNLTYLNVYAPDSHFQDADLQRLTTLKSLSLETGYRLTNSALSPLTQLEELKITSLVNSFTDFRPLLGLKKLCLCMGDSKEELVIRDVVSQISMDRHTWEDLEELSINGKVLKPRDYVNYLK